MSDFLNSRAISSVIMMYLAVPTVSTVSCVQLIYMYVHELHTYMYHYTNVAFVCL